MKEDKLEVIELAQIETDSCMMQTLMIEDTHMEEPHEDVSIVVTCASLEILEDGPYAGKGKGIFLM